MDTRSPEQRQADDALLEAIQNRMRLVGAEEGHPTAEELAESAGEVVVEYVVVARIVSMDLAERNASRYAYMTLGSGVSAHASPAHSISGLLYRGLRHMDSE